MIFKPCITLIKESRMQVHKLNTQNRQTFPLHHFQFVDILTKYVKHKQSIKKHQDFQLWHVQLINYEHTHPNYKINSILNETVYKFLFLDNCYQFWTTQMLRQHWNTVLFFVNWLLMQQTFKLMTFFFVCALCWSSISLQKHENLKTEKEYISYILISVTGFSVAIMCWTLLP